MQNIHPIIVHFPIALLCIFSFMEIIPVRKILPKYAWGQISSTFLLLGFGGALVALITGQMAAQVSGHSDLMDMHARFATITVYLYGIFMLDLLLQLISKYKHIHGLAPFLHILSKKYIRIALILLAFGGLLITGLLGGVLVYGAGVDPLAPYVLQVLGL